MSGQEPETVKNKKRRTALAFGATGIAAFLLGKMFGGFGDDVIGDTKWKNFRVSEDKDEMIFSDKDGEPIVIIDKESFRE